MHKIITLKPNSIIEEKEVKEITLEVLQREVQGYVEYIGFIPVFSKNQIAMFINEDGKNISLTPTAVIGRKKDDEFLVSDYVAGNALFVNMETGEETGLTPNQVKIVKDTLNSFLLLDDNMVSVLEV